MPQAGEWMTSPSIRSARTLDSEETGFAQFLLGGDGASPVGEGDPPGQ